VLFFWLIKRNLRLDKIKQTLIVKTKLLEDELKALDHSFLHFENGEQFLNVEHPFAYDLDLFGEGSMFQYLNRTATVEGRQRLANWLQKPLKEKVEIEKRQEAVKELAGMPLWRLDFLTEGNLFQETEVQYDEIRNWSEMELGLDRANWLKWMIRIVPAITVLAAIPAVLGVSNFYLVAMVFVQFLLLLAFTKQVNYYFGFFGRKSDLLAKYMQLLKLIEEKEFRSPYLCELKRKVTEPSAGKIFGELKSLVKEFEYRQNILVGVVLNGLFTWDIRCVYKLWLWHKQNHDRLARWLEIIAQVDAFISLANYANNHSDFVFPEITDQEFALCATELGHPLLKKDKRVNNDIEIEGWSKIMIVTGANMAGKSTFLRTVGTNILLAGMGAPVCATSMKIRPVDLYTNMRTTDSLLKDESYFFAELKRIKAVLDRLAAGEQIFVILDEMLKGTNSIDKLNGSKELVRKLAQQPCAAMIATHDLKLSDMEKELPQQVFNKCFEIRIENNELIFDYKLSEGVTQTMNATFLMKKMGII
jgi:DNA mismatch repair ATPase MutS